MGTSNFNVRRNSSVFLAMNNESVSGSFEEYKADYIENYEEDLVTDEQIWEAYSQCLSDDYLSEIEIFGDYLVEKINIKYSPNLEISRNDWSNIVSARHRIDVFGDVYFDIRLMVTCESGYYEGVAFDWEIEIEANDGSTWDSIDCFKDDFSNESLMYLCGAGDEDDDTEVYEYAAKSVISEVEFAAQELINEVESVFEGSYVMKIEQVGSFSDGTSIYKEIK